MQGHPGMLGCPPDATSSPTYFSVSLRPEPTTALFTLFLQCHTKELLPNLHTIGRGCPPTPPAQRACSSESSVCTSMASSGSPGSSKVEQSESDRGSLKARGCSSSIMDAHSHDHLHGSISGWVSPHLHISSPGGALGFDSPHPSTSCLSSSGSSPSSCVCSPSSFEEESSVQARRQQVLSSMMRSASWGAWGTKFANTTIILSSAQLRLLVTQWVGTHSALSLAGSYARMLPSNMRVRTMHR